MTARRRDVKKSEFVAVTDSQSTDSFDFVRNGQNLRMTQEDLILALGVSGPLQSIGDPAGIPVLSVSGGVNYIRNIIGGPGIMTSIGPQNGVKIQQNYNIDKVGIPVMINEGSDQPTFRSISGTGGIAVAAAGDQISISAGAPAATKTINIYELADFPTPVGNAITLADDTEYKILNDISSANYYVMGEKTVLSSIDESLIALEYTGTGNMIVAADKSCSINCIRLECPNGSLYDISSTTGLHTFRHYNGQVNCDIMGTMDNLRIVDIVNVSYGCATAGILYSGTFQACTLVRVGVYIPSGTGTAVDLGTAVFTVFQLFQGFGEINGTGYAVSGLANSGNIAIGGLGSIQNSKQFGTAGSLNNIGPYDDRWEMAFNEGIPDSLDSLLVTHGGTTLTITTPGVPVMIGATWLAHEEYRFTSTVGGLFTYNGKGSNVEINVSISADIATGIDNLSFYIGHNGSYVANSQVTREFNAGDVGNVTLVWALNLTQNDTVSFWAANDDTTVSIIIVNAVARVRS